MNCLLCKENEANQTGSHIFTHSLISKCINEQGKNGRDREIMFGFSQSGEKSLFVGRKVLPDNLAEVLGRELTDDEIENNTNGAVVDNIYCSNCEKLFGIIESDFSSKILTNIRDNGIYSYEYPNNILIRLYFYIQIWRASSYSYNDWCLPNKAIEEDLRKYIYEGCLGYEKGLSGSFIKEIVKYPLIVNYLETPEEESSSNLIFIPKTNNPFRFFLCDFVIEFFEDSSNKPLFSEIQNYHGLNDDISEKDINYYEDTFIIRNIANTKRKKIIDSYCKEEYVVGEIKRIQDLFVTEYKKINKRIPTDETIAKFSLEIAFGAGEVPTFQALSDERIETVVKKYIEF
ncbi:hypothetical protein DRF60_15035 [Chryseobacterium elymi]|uniref:HNH endonuclease n=1 Tax=Chryseobacterium elymi TaxID=395936 RepID=A0A3D9DCV5_9FLAO|nr:hypothetical protein [Chryseobacterium elymi]REC75823.1 hypothetical protein DRF60_15035 [Chryseobacterium elymi]